MNRPVTLLTCTLLVLALAGCQSSGSAVAMGLASSSVGDDEAVTLDQCPPAVRATIEAYLDGGTITELERTTDHGEVLYEVDVRGDGGVVEFDVAEDGTFRGYEGPDDDDDESDDDDDEDGDGDDDDESEEEIPLSDVPDHVKDAAIKAVPGLVLEEAEREIEGDRLVYELEGEADGREYEVEVSAAGVVLEIELDEDDD